MNIKPDQNLAKDTKQKTGVSFAASLEFRNIHHEYNGKETLQGINLTVEPGEVLCLLGPSGSGKTTLLRIIGGQERPDSGSVEIMGRDVVAMSRRELFAMRRKLGMLFQSSALFTDLSVFENVAFPLRAHSGVDESSIRDLVMMKLNAVGLRGARDLMPTELSGGMARRVALARAIALDPELLMYDEPFTGQDPIAMGVLVTLIKSLNAALGTTSVIVSHDIHETIGIADFIYVLADGEVIGSGTPQELQQSQSAQIHQFMHGEPDGPVPFHYPADEYKFDVLASG